MTYWFTSDTHFNHSKVIEYDNRPFRDLDEMTEALIENWNRVVKKGDIIFHLGDFAISYGKKHYEIIDAILSRLNGQKWLIKGNHDRAEVTENPRWVNVLPYHELRIHMGGVHKQIIVLSHYCFRTWNQKSRGSWNLHGHSHGNLRDDRGDPIKDKAIDVGVDSWGYRPIELAEIATEMDNRSIQYNDHHRS